MTTERFRTLALEEMTPEQRRIAEDILNGPRKELTGPFQALLRSPGLADPVQKVGEYLRFRTAIPLRLNELAILITARKWASQFEWYAHDIFARKAGVDPAIIASIAAGERPKAMQPDEAMIYDFCVEMLETGAVNEDTTEKVAQAFGERGLVDLIGVVGFYCMISMILNVGNFPMPNGIEPPLKALK